MSAADLPHAPTADAPAATAARPRRRWLRWTLGLLGTLVLLVVLAPLAVGCSAVRTRVEAAASEQAGTPVHVASLSAWWTSGLVLEGLEVASPPGHDGPLARVERVQVQVGLLALLRGHVEADVRVTRPQLMLRRNAEGRWNTSALAARRSAPEGSSASPGTAREPGTASAPGRPPQGSAPASGPAKDLPRLALRLEGGVVEAHGVGPDVQRMRDISLETFVAPDGAISTGLALLAERAGVGGADVPIQVEAGRLPGSASQLSASVPALDLARLAGLVEGLTGLRGLSGTTSLEARGELAADGSISGTLTLRGESLSARGPAGQRVALQRITGTLRAAQGPAGDRAAGELTLESLEVQAGEGPEARRVSEPSVRLRFDLEREPSGALTFSTLDVALGEALRIEASERLRITPSEGQPPSVEGMATLRADLARLSSLLGLTPEQGAAGGTLEARLQGASTPGGGARVEARIKGTDLAARTPGGARLTLASLEGSCTLLHGTAGDEATGSLRLADLRLAGDAGGTPLDWREPALAAELAATRTPEGVLTLARLSLTAGPGLALGTDGPLVLSMAEGQPASLEGRATLEADLARFAPLAAQLGGIEGLAGRLRAELRGQRDAAGKLGLAGTLSAAGVAARAKEGGSIALARLEGAVEASREGEATRAGARLDLQGLDLRAAGGPEAQQLLEPRLTARVSVAQAQGGALELALEQLAGTLLRMEGAQPFLVRRAADGSTSMAGPLDLRVDLAALPRVLPRALPAAQAAQLAGTLQLVGKAEGSAGDGALELALSSAGLRLPAGEGRPPVAGDVKGSVALRWAAGRSTLEGTLAGLGIEARATAQALPGEAGAGPQLEQVRLEARAALAEVARALGPVLGLAPGSVLEGRVALETTVRGPASARRLEGRLTAEQLAWQGEPGARRIEEPSVVLEHALVLGAGDGPLSIERLRLASRALALDLAGTQASDGAFDLRGTLRGDAALLAERLRALGGESVADLDGSGALEGRLQARAAAGGSPLAERLLASADLALGSWASSGARLEQVRFTAQRERLEQPLGLALEARINSGSARAALALTPARGRLPWTLEARLAQVDTSTFVMRNAMVKRLAMVLPTLVPFDAKTPALSGLLDASLTLAAPGVEEADLRTGLSGRGEVLLAKGTLGQSTLFGSLAGGNTLGDVGKALLRMAPEVSQALSGLAKAITYREISSRFAIAGEVLTIEQARMLAADHRLEMEGRVTSDAVGDLRARLFLEGKAGEEAQRVLPKGALPLRIRGPLARPEIRPDLKASDLLQGLLPSPADLLKDPKK
ncbi:MAG: AsmA family protein, partial [Planctomycetia bacterium]